MTHLFIKYRFKHLEKNYSVKGSTLRSGIKLKINFDPRLDVLE